MSDHVSKLFEQTTAFQNLWTDSMSRMAGVWTQYSPGSPPPEEVRKMRGGMLKILTETLDEYMRTPLFMEMMKASLNGALDLRQVAREGMQRVHEQFETPDKTDIDGILLAIRHVERRVLDRLDGFEDRLADVKDRMDALDEPANSQQRPPRPSPRKHMKPKLKAKIKTNKPTSKK